MLFTLQRRNLEEARRLRRTVRSWVDQDRLDTLRSAIELSLTCLSHCRRLFRTVRCNHSYQAAIFKNLSFGFDSLQR